MPSPFLRMCDIKVPHESMKHLFNVCAIIVSSGNTFGTALSVHHWPGCVISGQNLP